MASKDRISAIKTRRLVRRVFAVLVVACLVFCGGVSAKERAVEVSAEQVYAQYLWQRFDAKGKRISEQQWRIWRTPARMELSTGARREIWERREDGALSLMQIDVLDKSMLEYQPSDLQGMGTDYSWQKITQLVDPEAIVGLQNQRVREGQFGVEQRYTRHEGELRLTLAILPALAVPASWEIKTAQGTERLKLVRVEREFPVSDPPTSAQQLSALMAVQFADLGDRENDPRVHRLLGMFLPGHVHTQFSMGQALSAK